MTRIAALTALLALSACFAPAATPDLATEPEPVILPPSPG